jgi:hypothetical protein
MVSRNYHAQYLITEHTDKNKALQFSQDVLIPLSDVSGENPFDHHVRIIDTSTRCEPLTPLIDDTNQSTFLKTANGELAVTNENIREKSEVPELDDDFSLDKGKLLKFISITYLCLL